MRTVLTFLLAFMVSLLAASTASIAVADLRQAGEEFILVLMALPVFVSLTLIVFAAVYWRAGSARAFSAAAAILSIVVVLMAAGPIGYGFYKHRTASISLQDIRLLAPAVVIGLLVVLIQAWMIRRRWQRARASGSR